MTSTLLLRLAATRQSWGGPATQRWRPTEKIPTRTGLEGLLGAALGTPRGERSPLCEALTIHVRVDRAGTVEEDFHTVSPPPEDIARARHRRKRLRTSAGKGRADFTVPLGDGSPWVVGGVHTLITRRTYLADAEFMAAFTGPDTVIEELSAAVRNPVYAPYLGRAAFAPQFPFHLGVRAGDGVSVLGSVSTTTVGDRALPVYAIDTYRPAQVARVQVPVTADPLTDWKHP